MTKLNLWAYKCVLNGYDFGVTLASSGTDMTPRGWVFIKELEEDIDNEDVAKKIAAAENSTKAAKRALLMKALEDLEDES